jgi:hypothetical protein
MRYTFASHLCLPSKPCAAYKLLDARGSGEPQGVSLMFHTIIERLLANNTGADGVAASVESVVLVGNPYRTTGRRSYVDQYGKRDNRVTTCSKTKS